MGSRWGRALAAIAAAVAASSTAAPAGAAVVVLQHTPGSIFGSSGGPLGGMFDLQPYLYDADGRSFVITSASLSVTAQSDPNYGAPKVTKTSAPSGAYTVISFNPLLLGQDVTETTTKDYMDSVADSLTLMIGFGLGPTVSGTVSQVLNTTSTVNNGTTEAPFNGPIPVPIIERTTHIEVTNHKAIFGPLALNYAYDADGLGDLNLLQSANYLLSTWPPGYIPDFGAPPPSGVFTDYAATFTFDRYQVSGPPLPVETAPVPEPATWALMILGFGAAGASLRRRRAAHGFR